MRRPLQFQDHLFHELCLEDGGLFDFDLSDQKTVLTKEEKLLRRRAQIAKSAQKHRLRIREEIESLQAQQEELEGVLEAMQLRWREAAKRERLSRQEAEAINRRLRQTLAQTKSCVSHWREFMPRKSRLHPQKKPLRHHHPGLVSPPSTFAI
ncbi:Aste57867_10897 [Aphanomyces stellatus]|uniref:Aste57867_10897 protein n=1 Tax=Aphanomyces stellatus TaxID=120398 RepID=A0A485KT74_9STRA|nr:hypothetical protein As57867_010857 [Aphanomyces stellatus]VFT87765.1 Aste57867_10897 [Aphanomyces stellatus]